MGCGCGKNINKKIFNTPKEKDTLTGKTILDSDNKILLVTAPIYDSYNNIIGYVTKNINNGKVERIFAKNIVKILR